MRSPVPEILDRLAADDPRAIRSRRDLARINAVMGQSRIMARALAGFAPPRRIADLGGGDGRFLLSVARRLRQWRGVEALILDRQDIVSRDTRDAFDALGWTCKTVQGDIFETLPRLEPELVTANLFLHHLSDCDLENLLDQIGAHAGGFVACEPRRSAFALAGAHLVFALGANDVTRHDAVASVRSGFRAQELSALWPRGERWRLDEGGIFPFTHRLVAHHA